MDFLLVPWHAWLKFDLEWLRFVIVFGGFFLVLLSKELGWMKRLLRYLVVCLEQILPHSANIDRCSDKDTVLTKHKLKLVVASNCES